VIGECIHGAVLAPLVSDLAEPRLPGGYMALSAREAIRGTQVAQAA